MKLVKEHIIFEKFTEDSDPVRDLGIGGRHIREFETAEEAANFFLDNISIVSKFESLEHLKKVMKHYDEPEASPSILREVKDFLDGWNYEYTRAYGAIHIKEWGVPFDQQKTKLPYLKDFRDLILYKLKQERVNEKFAEDSDPIHDMGIGIQVFWDKELEKEGSISSYQSSINYFGTPKHTAASYVVYKVLKNVALQNPSSQKEIQKIFEDIILHIMPAHRNDAKRDIKKVKEALKKFFYIDVDITSVKFRLEEKFEEYSDPVSDMGIGISHIFPQICKSILEHDKSRLIFTIKYVQSHAPKFNFDKFITIYLNHPRMNDFKELCTLDAIKNYVKTIIINSLEYKDVFSDINSEGRFKYYLPDIDEDFYLLKSCPTLYCEIKPEVKLKYKVVQVQRDPYDYNIINIRTE